MTRQDSPELFHLTKLLEIVFDARSVDDVYQGVAEVVPNIVPADHVTITLYDVAKNQLIIRSLFGDSLADRELSVGEALPARSTYAAYAESVANPIIECPRDNLNTEINAHLHKAGIQSILIVPLYSMGKVIGTINIGSKSYSYELKDQFRLGQIASLLGYTIAKHEQVKLTEADSARHQLYSEHLEFLNELAEELTITASVTEALDLAAQCATKLVNATRVSFCELDSKLNTVRIIGLVGDSNDTYGTLVKLEDSGLEESLLQDKKSYETNLVNSNTKARRSLGMSGYNHVWSYPIKGHQTTKRCLNICSTGCELSQDDALSVLDTLSRLISSTLQRLNAQEKLKIQATTDSLTGLGNRDEFRNKLQLAVDASRLSGDLIGIMYFDLDHFKSINDTLGHYVGDEVLKLVAKRIQYYLHESDTFARVGGDEFMILKENLKSSRELQTTAQALIDALSEPFRVHSHSFFIGVSIGICQIAKDGYTVDELIKNADIAMYKAKDLGRNQYVCYSVELYQQFADRLQLERDLRQALQEDEFHLVFQPQFNLIENCVDSVETLLRWIHPQRGFVPPDVFIPIAENSGLMPQVTDWVLKNALQILSELQHFQNGLRVAVNVSAMEFSPQHNLYERVSLAIEKSGVAPSNIEFEITETAFIKHPDHASNLAKKLNELGIKLAIDDFGTGFASLSCLVDLPIGCIKVDKSFVDNVTDDPRKQAVINGIVAISESLGVNCVGEGVETTEVLTWIKNAGCKYAQGYLLSKPVDADQLAQTIRSLNNSSQLAA